MVDFFFQMEDIEHIVSDIHHGNTSAAILNDLHNKLNESRILDIPDDKLVEARELANNLTSERVSEHLLFVYRYNV